MSRHSIIDWFDPANKPGVYCIQNKVTGRKYIGATTNPMRQRWRQHRGMLIRGRHRNTVLQRDWNEYGEAAFEFSVVEVVKDARRVFERERYWQDRDFTPGARYNPPNQPQKREEQPPVIRLSHEEVAGTRRMIKHYVSALRPTRASTIWAGFALEPIDGEAYDRAVEIFDKVFESLG